MTANDPFWSLDRLEFVRVGELAIGERLQTLAGDVKWVQQKLPRPGPTPVYNLEVQDEHVYYVGASGVLAHNVGGGSGKGKGEKSSASCDTGNISDELVRDNVNATNQLRSRQPHDAEVFDYSVFVGDGVIYRVPGTGTPSGLPYIGSADDKKKRTLSARDGRDRSIPSQIGSYPIGSVDLRKLAEQIGIDENGGIEKLDNRRNEIRKKRNRRR